MMRPILVHALRCLALVALAEVAEVAHELGLVFSRVMLAHIDYFKAAQHLLAVVYGFDLEVRLQLSIVVAN